MPPQVDVAESERLKAIGNEHYRNGEHDAAYHKFSEAIKKNPSNAILWANRAAVSLAKKEYFDAATDCRKAVELDPSYAKAWGRLGTALHTLANYPEAHRAYTRALAALPQPPTALSPTETTLKVQFTQGLQKAKRELDKMKKEGVQSDLREVPIGTGRMPWDRAQALFQRKAGELHQSGKVSCVMLITQAEGERKDGLKYLAQAKTYGAQNARGENLEMRHTGVIEYLSNSILSCDRTFHATDINSFMENIGRQCNFEDKQRNGWVNAGGPARVKEEVTKRLKKEGGWDAGGVKMALVSTIRIWIFYGYIRARIMGHREFAHEAFSNAIEIIRWVREQWPNVPASKRGSVFERTFMRGVRRLQLENMHAIVASGGEDCPLTLQDLIDLGEEVVEEVDQNPHDPSQVQNIYMILAFWRYPKAVAHSVIAWATLEQAVRLPPTSPTRLALLEKASTHYLTAAQSTPTDDYIHLQFLRKHLECLSALARPLAETLPVARDIVAAAPEVLDIWGEFVGDDTMGNVEEVREFERVCREDVEAGRCGLDEVRGVGFSGNGKGVPKGRMVPVKVMYGGDEEDKEEEGKQGEDKKEVDEEKDES